MWSTPAAIQPPGRAPRGPGTRRTRIVASPRPRHRASECMHRYDRFLLASTQECPKSSAILARSARTRPASGPDNRASASAAAGVGHPGLAAPGAVTDARQPALYAATAGTASSATVGLRVRARAPAAFVDVPPSDGYRYRRPAGPRGEVYVLDRRLVLLYAGAATPLARSPPRHSTVGLRPAWGRFYLMALGRPGRRRIAARRGSGCPRPPRWASTRPRHADPAHESVASAQSTRSGREPAELVLGTEPRARSARGSPEGLQLRGTAPSPSAAAGSRLVDASATWSTRSRGLG